MEFTEIKGRMFGYSKKDVCSYISQLNEIHAAELAAHDDKASKMEQEYKESAEALRKENETLGTKLNELTSRFEEMEAKYNELLEEKTNLQVDYDALSMETADLRAKSEVISTAIINAEKCASTMINDANMRAQDMISDAEEKVDEHTKRLEVAKRYIVDVRNRVEETLRNIDRELSGVVADIDEKTDDVNSSKKTAVKEKFGIFKRA